jgi:hypothetical protein
MSIIGKLTRNPMDPLVEKLGDFQKMDLVSKAKIDAVLEEMEKVNYGFECSARDPRIRKGNRDKLQQGAAQFNRVIAGVRADLNNPAEYVLKEGYYIKTVKP